MRHFLNGMKTCDCLGCKSANDEEEINEEEKDKKKLSQEEEEKEKKVDDIAKAEKHEKRIEEIKKSLRKLTSQELDDELEKLTAELHELQKQLHPEEDEKKQSKQASVEFLGVDSQISRTKQTKYSVLNYEPYHDNITSGDALLIRMGSTDDNTVGNSNGDNFLRMLGSVD